MKSSTRNPEPRTRRAAKREAIGMEIKDNGLPREQWSVKSEQLTVDS
jgi:hypothetical protein